MLAGVCGATHRMFLTRLSTVECSLFPLEATEHVILHWPGLARGALRVRLGLDGRDHSPRAEKLALCATVF